MVQADHTNQHRLSARSTPRDPRLTPDRAEAHLFASIDRQDCRREPPPRAALAGVGLRGAGLRGASLRSK